MDKDVGSGLHCNSACTVLPPATHPSILFSFLQNFLLGEVLTVHPPDHPEKPVVDIPLHLPFLLFTLDQVLQIVACILTQQRIVFLSQDFAVITPIIEVSEQKLQFIIGIGYC